MLLLVLNIILTVFRGECVLTNTTWNLLLNRAYLYYASVKESVFLHEFLFSVCFMSGSS